jgi:myotubularin-related protein 1/2
MMIVELMLDKYYRTLEGFCVLIEKDWCSFGHQFEKRIGHGSRNFKEDERGPIFFQFLETVYQLINQFPTAFEFNEECLVFIMDNVYSCRFGTFLFNHVKDRKEKKVFSDTVSIWTYILNEKEKFLNPFYDPDKMNNHILFPDLKNASIVLWNGYWLRSSSLQILQERGVTLIKEIYEKNLQKKENEKLNEQTVNLFQNEFKTMSEEIQKLKNENNEWKER